MAKLTVKLLGEPIQNEDDKAAEAITPGHLVAHDSNGDLVKHASAGGYTHRAFAMEREEMGDDMNVPYAAGDTVKVGVFYPGCRVNAIIGSGVSTTKGVTYLESAGNGKLRAWTSGERIGLALETASPTADARLVVEVV